MHLRITLATASLGLAMVCGNVFADPLADMDALASRCKQAFDGRPMTQLAYVEAANSWVKRQFMPAEVVARVQKTSSLVTPFVAQITVTEVATAQRGADEDALRATDLTAEQNVMRTVHTIHLAFQENAWVVMGGTSVASVKRDAGDDFTEASVARLSRNALSQTRGPLAMCLHDAPNVEQTEVRVVP